jgi:hypothetical protein
MVALTVAMGAVSFSPAHAVSIDIYGNLGTVNTTSTSNTVGYLSNIQSNQFQAQGFSVGGSAWNIESIDLGLGSNGSPFPIVRIFSNLAGSPGSALASFTSGSAVSSKAIYSFTGSFVALENASYWVVLSNANSASQESYEWYSNDAFSTPAERHASGLSYLGTKESNDGGAWSNTLPSLSISLRGSSPNPTPVPEIDPTSLGSVLALVAGSLGLLERRARRMLGLMA